MFSFYDDYLFQKFRTNFFCFVTALGANANEQTAFTLKYRIGPHTKFSKLFQPIEKRKKSLFNDSNIKG